MKSRFRIIETLGEGAAGRVYKAEDLKLGRTVALKYVPSSLETQKPDPLAEARAVAALRHPNIATLYDLEEQEGKTYLALELVEGQTLRQRRDAEGPFDLRTAIDVATQVAGALAAAHEAQVIHRDVKSSNLMLTANGAVKVLDFGLAQTRSTVPGNGEAEESERGVAGTPGYMSPEQIRGEPLDGRTDIFALGVVLYEMVAGRLPFQGATRAEVLHAALHQEAPVLGRLRDDVPLMLESIVRKALYKDRRERYNTAREMLTDLLELRRTLLPMRGSSPPSQDSPARSPSDRRAVGQVALGVGVLALLVALLDLLLRRFGVWPWLGGGGLVSLGTWAALALRTRRDRTGRVAALPQGAAFRGLLPFQEADRDRFFGRDVDTLALFERIAQPQFRFGILYGESGAGKTSLLQAGLVPRLREEGFFPLYYRPYRPLSALEEDCRRQSQVEARGDESLTRYLRRVAEELGTVVVVVCDQFEEFFVQGQAAADPEPFSSFVETCHQDTDLPVKVLLSMRGDFLYKVDAEFGPRIRNPLMSSRLYRLQNFARNQVMEVIEKSASRARLPLETSLIRQVAHDLSVGNVVSPSELQIVGEELQRKRILTLHQYRQVGGKEALVHDFLEDVIRASSDQVGARLVLNSLISEESTRLTLPLQEIARRVQRSREAVARLLVIFTGARLVREVQEQEPWRYELMHEYLIEKIHEVTGKVMDARRRANHLFRQYLTNFAIDRRNRIPMTRLWFVRRYSDLPQGDRERRLMKTSLRWGMAKAGLFVLGLGLVVGAATAAFSVREDWQEVRLRDGHTAAVRKAVFSPDGTQLVSAGEDGMIVVWSFKDRTRLATLREHTSWIGDLAFSPDGQWFVSAGRDGNVIVWDAKEHKLVRVLSEGGLPLEQVEFSHQGELLVGVDSAGKITVWKVSKFIDSLRGEDPILGHAGYPHIATLFFSPDDRWVVHPYGFAWSLISGERGARFVELDATEVAISPNHNLMIGVNCLGQVRFWDVSRFWDLRKHQELEMQQAHHDHGRSVAFSPDGQLAVSGAEDIVLWDTGSRTILDRMNYPAIVWSLSFSPDGKYLVSTHGDGAILVWDLATRRCIANMAEHAGPVRSVAFSPDGTRVASAGQDQSVIVWDLSEDGRNGQGRGPPSPRIESVLQGHQTMVNALAFLRHKSILVSCDQRHTLQFWDLRTRRSRRTFETPWGICAALEVAPDDQWLVTPQGAFDVESALRAWWFRDPVFHSYIYGMAFSPDGTKVALVTATSQSANGRLYLLDKGLSLFFELDGESLSSVDFSPAGDQLVTGEDEGVIRLWELDPLRPVAILGSHGARVQAVAFSPNGQWVASGGDDRRLSLWDVKRRRWITDLGTQVAPVRDVAFSPDSRHLVSGGHDNAVRLYRHYRTLWGYRFDEAKIGDHDVP